MSSSDHLGKAASLAPADTQDFFVKFAEYFERKLWHELTLIVISYYSLGTAVSRSLIPLYNDFICAWQQHMSPLSYIKLAIQTAHIVDESDGPEKSILLLEDAGKRAKDNETLSEQGRKGVDVLVGMETAWYLLRLDKLSESKIKISSFSNISMESLFSVDPLIPATFFRISADYDKATLEFSQYYRNTLLFLSADAAVKKLNNDHGCNSDVERAHDLCVAALLGKSTFNFGELLVHPILATLESNSSFGYLREAVIALNAGDQTKFPALIAPLMAHPTIGPRMPFLQEKMSLMALVEAAFHKLQTNHALSFSEVSLATGVDLGRVELFLMHAMSMKLIRGTIDEPSATFNIQWVLPRVLDMAQIATLRCAVQAWRTRVSQTTASLV